MTDLLTQEITNALRTVEDPDLHQDLVSLGMVKSVDVRDGHATVVINLTTPACPLKGKIQSDVEEAVRSVPGVRGVTVNLLAEVGQGRIGEGKAPLPGVKNIIAVSSGKGGVGKSTIAVNLAVALGRAGAAVALLDADIYGPNVPRMMGVHGSPKVVADKMMPKVAHGIKVNSMGLMIGESQPLIWRGPMLHKALTQLLHDTNWGDVDYLVIDLPPGTGDVQLSLVQQVPVSGAVVVSTPQAVALADAVKGVNMFRETGLPIAGIVENMAYYECGKCGERSYIFGQGGARRAADELGVPFLGEVPLVPLVREGGDEGRPAAAGDSPIGQVFAEIAQRVAQQISILNAKQK